MRLYDSPISGNCYKVRLLLSHLGREYERVEVDVDDRDGRERLLGGKTPTLRVPVLELDDGRCLTESNAILWWLARDTDYVPGEELEAHRVMAWLFFEQNQHEPNLAVVRHWIHLGAEERLGPQIATRRERGHEALAVMERHLRERPFFVADLFSVADIALYAYTHVGDEGGFDLQRYPAILGWLERVAALPGHVPMR